MSGIFGTIDDVTKENAETVKPEEPKNEGIFGVIDEAEKEKAEETVKEQESSKEEPTVESIVDLNNLETEENK